ncbi:MAG TPA: LLM class flavin-dependent oxidoreductase, partial [Acidimicrobiales bacterium]|nr:LLM class flavin-dependent oxidoreductase [Acidimicrobiales bacterium]
MSPRVGGRTIGFGVRVPPSRPLGEVARCIVHAEQAGFHTAWVPDSQFLFRDPWMALSAAALHTSSIRLATGVTNFQTRHPSVTASALQTLEEVAPGRAVLAVGTGESSIKTLGWQPSHLHDVETAFATVRTLSRGASVTFGGRPMRLSGATTRVPPVFLAATGPRTLRLAGRIADGVLIMAGVAPRLIERALRHVDEGLREARRTRADIEICLGAVCYMADEEADV